VSAVVRTLVIVNPNSRSGSTGRRWSKIEPKLREALGGFEVETTTRMRDAERISREAVRAGVERVVVAGGDGTLSEVVTGLLGAQLGGYAQIGILPLGTGGDFSRVAGGTRNLDEAIAALAVGTTRKIDAGRITYRVDTGSSEATSYFANVASFGVSGLVDELVNRTTKFFGGRISFLLGTLRALAQYRSQEVAIRVDGEPVFEGRIAFAAVANGSYFGGGMQVAPDAILDDGRLRLVVIPASSKASLLARLPTLYRGTHVNDESNLVVAGSVIEADADARVLLDVDGEPLGALPARIECLPGAITLFGVGS
jgi:YegS/Rv2252/BmrU family lipid kinase